MCWFDQLNQNRILKAGNFMIQRLATHLKGCYWQPHTTLCFTSWIRNVIGTSLDRPLKISFIRHVHQAAVHFTTAVMRDILLYWARKKIIKLSKCIGGKKKGLFKMLTFWFLNQTCLLKKKPHKKNEISGHTRNIIPKMSRENWFQTE